MQSFANHKLLSCSAEGNRRIWILESRDASLERENISFGWNLQRKVLLPNIEAAEMTHREQMPLMMNTCWRGLIWSENVVIDNKSFLRGVPLSEKANHLEPKYREKTFFRMRKNLLAVHQISRVAYLCYYVSK